MERVSRRRVLFVIVLLCCISLFSYEYLPIGSVQAAYSVSGRIVDSEGFPVSGVTVSFGNQGESVVTDEDGTWSMDGLQGRVILTPGKSGWTFTPEQQIVETDRDNVDFIANWGDPSGFFNEEVIVETQLAPGITLYSLSGSYNYLSTKYPIKAYVVKVNLSHPNIFAGLLVGERLLNPNQGHYWPRSRTSQLLTDNSAFVAANGGFFYMTQATGATTQGPTQFTVQDGKIIRSPEFPGGTSIGFTGDGRAVVGVFRWNAEVVTPYGNQKLDGINLSILGGNQLILFASPWDRSPGTDRNFMLNVSRVTEVKLEVVDFQKARREDEYSTLRGVVRGKEFNGSSIKIFDDVFVLRGANEFADFLNQLQYGDEVEIKWRYTVPGFNVDWYEIGDVLSGYHRLVLNGKPIYAEHDRHPRTAVGISSGGTRLAMVVVDGRSQESQGIGLYMLADFLVHMGVHHGLNLDGGGSTTLVITKDGAPYVVNSPSDGSERYVADGIGIFVE